MGLTLPKPKIPGDITGYYVYRSVYTQPQSSEWVHWNTMISEETEDVDDSKKKIQDTLVSTLDTVRYKYIMDLCIRQNRLQPSEFHHIPV